MKNGFTFIEVLVYSAILAVVTGAIVAAMLGLIEFYNISRFNRAVLNNAHSGLNTILLEVKHASSIYTPTSNVNQLSLETNLNPPSGEINTYVDFYLDNGILCVKREGADAQPLTSEKVEITALTFNYLIDSVKTDITVRYRSPKVKYQREITLSSSSSLR
ncbi:prepilin-type N-terminal cleavage/methylation domain-containing protein [Candidatus Parcubacteria bacterium]|nr:prepilin-type N-terminal cleavage/methylation domain-containing protein [Candidatus Parcubacteria bacterium]